MAKNQENSSTIPVHIGFIVDGNRRWAREKGLPTLEGHRRGFKKVEDVASECVDKGIKFVSFYLFSTENWSRAEDEVAYLMDLVRKNAARLKKRFLKEDIRCVVMGRKDPAPEDILKRLTDLEEATKNGSRGTVCICFNYGGHWEIADAATKLVAAKMASLKDSGIPPTFDVTPEEFADYLYCPEVPACDLIVRTSGEERISGFQLWRAAYSEFLFLDKYFPDIDPKEDVDAILTEFNRRQRRFGK